MSTRRSVGALIGLALGTFLYTTAEALPIGLLIPMAKDLGVEPTAIGSLVTIYAVVVMVASVPLTALVRRVPRRLLLAVVLAGFTVSNVVAAVSSSFEVLAVTRLVTGATHAVFWAVVVPAAAELFRPEIRGRVVSVVFAGGTIALALGVPAGTWLGDALGWRWAVAAVAVLGAITVLIVTVLMPNVRAEQGHAARGSAPDRRGFWVLVSAAVLTTAGTISAYTYVALFVTEISGLAPATVGAVLFARGLASVVGIFTFGAIVDRNPWLSLIASVALQTAALLGLTLAGSNALVAVVLISVAGLAFAGFTATLGALVLQVAPGRSDIAAATLSAAVNVGVAAGAFVAGLALPELGVMSTVTIGVVLGVVAIAVVVLTTGLPAARRADAPARSSA